MLSQKDAVFQAVTGYFGSRFQNGMEVTDEDKKAIVDRLIKSYNDKEWEIKRGQENLAVYCRGLLNNHLARDKRLNGGKKYEPKTKGAPRATGDETAKALRALALTLTGEAKAQVEAELESHLKKLRIEKLTKKINTDSIPEHLRHLIPSTEEDAA